MHRMMYRKRKRICSNFAFPKLTITRIFQRFCETGVVEDRQRSRRPSTITKGTVDEVRDVCAMEPISSVRGVATVCSIPQTTPYRIMTEYLSLKPSKIHFVQQTYDEDMQHRVEMCRTLILRLEDNVQENGFLSDEATFHLNRFMNKHSI